MKIRIGTDCSGIDAPIQALLNMGVDHSHVFSSDIDNRCIQSLKVNYDRPVIFGDAEGPFPDGDITSRCIDDVPDLDLYVCGFPCQPFSMAGMRRGFSDARGTVFWSCLEVIRCKRPTYFVLENVKSLLTHDSGNTWGTIMRELSSLDGYTIHHRVLNTKDYGIPQNRERIWIVGVKDSIPFEWPVPVAAVPLRELVDDTDQTRYEWRRKQELNVSPGAVFVDVDFLKYTDYPNAHVNSPCVVARSSHWCVPHHRYATTVELLRLQGFPDTFKQVVPNSYFKKQIGNSMSVCVVEAIFTQLLKSLPS